ncbi:transmembrane amino acid transporter protein [Ditylenchus destructor]|nr:transmembrane amino acid transporter protein [Ditylenchus destructor]
MAGRRFQDWTNRNVFVNSFESPSDFPLASYQNQCEGGEGSKDPYAWPDQENSTAGAEQSPQNFADGISAELQSKANSGGDHLEEAEPVGTSITALQAAWNVTNAIQGMFIVGLPFAVKVGGWTAVFAFVWVAYVCYRTGLSLIDCLYEDGKKVRHSYREIAEAVQSGLGKFVLFAQLTELASTCILYLGCVPSIDRSAWMMLVAAALLGTAFLDDIRIVSHLSLANAVSHLVINAIIVLLLPTVLGVVVFGYTSHIFLPALEGSMEDPKEFPWMLRWSHISAAFFKAIFGLIGFLTFAEFTQKEISNSLPNQFFKVVVNMVLVVKALLSYPLPYFAIVKLMTDNFFRGAKFTWFSSCYGADRTLREWAVCLRIILLLWTLMMALSVPYLIEFMGLIGNITGTVLSFIWPAYFHLRLKGSKLSIQEQRFNKFVIGMGFVICLVGVYYSAMELRSAMTANQHYQ